MILEQPHSAGARVLLLAAAPDRVQHAQSVRPRLEKYPRVRAASSPSLGNHDDIPWSMNDWRDGGQCFPNQVKRYGSTLHTCSTGGPVSCWILLPVVAPRAVIVVRTGSFALQTARKRQQFSGAIELAGSSSLHSVSTRPLAIKQLISLALDSGVRSNNILADHAVC